MGLVKGNPIALVVLFFGSSVVSMGGIYALIPEVLDGPSLAQIALIDALAVSLLFSMLMIARVFWVVGRPSRNARAASASGKR